MLSKKPYRGTRDLFPREKRIQDYLFGKMKKVAESFGYEAYDGPLLEELALYRAKSGEELVGEQVYAFTDRGGREVAIRPEMTPTLARMVAEVHKEVAKPIRWYSIPNLMRYERPQKGRLREHWQFNCDIFGASSYGELEILQVAEGLFREFGASQDHFEILVNDRRIVDGVFRGVLGLDPGGCRELYGIVDKAKKLSRGDLEKKLRERFGGRVPEKLLGYLELGSLADLESYLGPRGEVLAEHASLWRLAGEAGVSNLRFDPTVVRGLDYYTGLVFEIFDKNPGSRALCGGGSYADLLGIFGSELGGAGFGLGDVTLGDFLERRGLLPDLEEGRLDFLVTYQAGGAFSRAFGLAQRLRREGCKVLFQFGALNRKKSFVLAGKRASRCLVLIGERELGEGTFQVSNLKTRGGALLFARPGAGSGPVRRGLTVDFPKTYSPGEIEGKWYARWEGGGYFKPRGGKPYCVLMPPPNVTGRLHAGHALDITTQDSLIRWKRMLGYKALWIPGMDHAGIATQNVVERLVYEREKKTRRDFTREGFLAKIWEWKEEYGGIIDKQQRAMGAGPDWDYSLFTMDAEASAAVCKAFVSLYNEGLIYRSDYIVNWDPVLRSAISDAEVEHIEVEGAFYHIEYPVKGSSRKLEVATTRPETLLADTALCVHPEDRRYSPWIGKTAVVPLCGREVPIIADRHVDPDKGTGCLKVTPGHDFHDFEIGRRHGLPVVRLLNPDGTLNENGLQWQNLSAREARPLVVEALKERGFFKGRRAVRHSVAHGDRTGAVIEPVVSKQWFLNVKKMAGRAVRAVESGETKFYPRQWENTYFAWLKEPKDWCLSRQLWWGHRIPVYYCGDCGRQWASESAPSGCPDCGGDWEQDPDVLDTWFSSALWPLSTLGWPDSGRMRDKGFEEFYPGDVLVTGYDIIFFLGGPHDDDGVQIRGKSPVQARLHPRHRPRQIRPQDVQIPQQRNRPPGHGGALRGRRLPLRPGGGFRLQPQHQPGSRPDRRLPELHEQDLERVPLYQTPPRGGGGASRATRRRGALDFGRAQPGRPENERLLRNLPLRPGLRGRLRLRLRQILRLVYRAFQTRFERRPVPGAEGQRPEARFSRGRRAFAPGGPLYHRGAVVAPQGRGGRPPDCSKIPAVRPPAGFRFREAKHELADRGGGGHSQPQVFRQHSRPRKSRGGDFFRPSGSAGLFRGKQAGRRQPGPAGEPGGLSENRKAPREVGDGRGFARRGFPQAGGGRRHWRAGRAPGKKPGQNRERAGEIRKEAFQPQVPEKRQGGGRGGGQIEIRGPRPKNGVRQSRPGQLPLTERFGRARLCSIIVL